jgi:hypothetical protein
MISPFPCFVLIVKHAQRRARTAELAHPVPNTMPSVTQILSMLGLVALPLVNSLPNHLEALLHEPGITERNRAQVMDVSMLNFAPWNITDLHILCNRPNTTADYNCNLTCETLFRFPKIGYTAA